ncbi:hypothetical protein CD30_12895 [Ureibacillus massiliensis 4400831 = CIP 108448 = CCUG 49529]|uniref:Uncharacterized protein n=1 Tax=Ureibacillus massiliensis 4400831 = CIP 108448 = CCUG 49529 TaxID=1211035 RepID=A0A0A3J531_9BACL|nr:hypothetical protein [Ureibacillus massiliensis]KGR90258.1 hypothetical protein CD30_12895 [Ureibacillus massiliensis 4400831 = CIP 108448 = CCUG 49529]
MAKNKLVVSGALASILVLSSGVVTNEAHAKELTETKETFYEQITISELSSVQKYEYNSLIKEVSAINQSSKSQLNKKEAVEKLLQNANKDVVRAYANQINKEIQDTINSFDPVSSTELVNQTFVQEKVLSDGSKIVLTIEDKPVLEQGLDESASMDFQILSEQDTLNIGYGSRYLTYTFHYYAAAYPDPTFVLTTYYDADRYNGLTGTSTSTAGTSTIFPYSIATHNHDIIDDRAESAGTSISSQADFTLAGIGFNGIGLIQLDITLRTKITLNSIGSTSANITYYSNYDY